MREEDAKIQELFKKYDKFTTPTAAFITFESDDSREIAVDFNSDLSSKKKVIGAPMVFEDASEPTDIIWENRHWSAKALFIRQLIATAIIAVLLMVSFVIIFLISTYSAKIQSVFPPVECEGIKKAYTGDLFKEYAVDDYEYISTRDDVQSSGTLQCFCQQEKIDNPDSYMTDTYGSADNVAICGKYEDLVTSVYYWTTALSYLLIGINYILRTVCIKLVDWVGFDTETVRLSKTTSMTFYVQFFNSAFLLLLINADMSEQPFSFGIVSGSFGDFNGAWFRTVGNVLIGAMFFNLYYPLIEAGAYLGIRSCGRCRDRGCTWSGKTTKQTSVQGYLNVYSGPIYYMHYKYSSIMTNAFITFIYGFGMPILFPIACGSFFVLYVVERWLLFYGYRLPPMYDERLSQDVLNKLQLAPLLYLAFGYWMASNQQLISNGHLEKMSSTQDTPITSHTYGSVFDPDGWVGVKWPLLVALIILSVLYFCGSWIEALLAKCCEALRIGDIELNEEIDNYWAALDSNDREWSQKEEENNRNLPISQLLTDEQYDRLNSTKPTDGKTLQGVHSYDILANPLYLDDFQYVSAAEENRDLLIIDDDDQEGNDTAQSDLVRIALNMAYLTEQEGRTLKFD